VLLSGTRRGIIGIGIGKLLELTGSTVDLVGGMVNVTGGGTVELIASEMTGGMIGAVVISGMTVAVVTTVVTEGIMVVMTEVGSAGGFDATTGVEVVTGGAGATELTIGGGTEKLSAAWDETAPLQVGIAWSKIGSMKGGVRHKTVTPLISSNPTFLFPINPPPRNISPAESIN